MHTLGRAHVEFCLALAPRSQAIGNHQLFRNWIGVLIHQIERPSRSLKITTIMALHHRGFRPSSVVICERYQGRELIGGRLDRACLKNESYTLIQAVE
jgi:hypothetical protein